MPTRTPVRRPPSAAHAVVPIVAVTGLLWVVAIAPAGAQRGGTPTVAAVTKAWIREAPPGQTWTAAYATVANPSGSPISLVGMDVPFAGAVELHDTTIEHDTMRMKKVSAIVVPPNGTVVLKPGGLHAMVFALSRPCVVGERVMLVFRFSDGQVTVPAEVRPRLAVAP